MRKFLVFYVCIVFSSILNAESVKDKNIFFNKAVCDGDFLKVKSFLEDGVNPNTRDSEGKSVLSLTLRLYFFTKMMEAFSENFSLSVSKSKSEVSQSYLNIFKNLIESGALLTKEDKLLITLSKDNDLILN